MEQIERIIRRYQTYGGMNMPNLDEKKLSSLRRFDDVLNEKYGRENSSERKDFEAKARTWYYAELLKDER